MAHSAKAREFLEAEYKRYSTIVRQSHKKAKVYLNFSITAALLSAAAIVLLVGLPPSWWVTIPAALSAGWLINALFSTLKHMGRADFYHGLQMESARSIWAYEAEWQRLTNYAEEDVKTTGNLFGMPGRQKRLGDFKSIKSDNNTEDV